MNQQAAPLTDTPTHKYIFLDTHRDNLPHLTKTNKQTNTWSFVALACIVRYLIPTSRIHVTALISERMHHMGIFIFLFTNSAARGTLLRFSLPILSP